jgi:hypothetical protein
MLGSKGVAPAVRSTAKSNRLTASEQAAELRRLVPRLQTLVAQHLESAKAMGIAVTKADLGVVLGALEAEASGKEYSEWPDDEVTRFVLESLYEELVAEPSNIFLHTQVDAQTMRYEAMPAEVWLACLADLRHRLDL